jgi:hypothetical protein
MSTKHIRSKWAAVGAAIAVSLGAGGIGITQATTSSGEKPIYLPIEPCRLADTRTEFQVGPRSVPLGPEETYTLSGQGAVGNCNLPAGTTALSLNVTAINTTAPTFVSLFPAGAPLPVASHLNPLPGQGPVPNAVNVDLNGDGEFSIYNLQGNVDIFIDVVGIFDDHTHDDRYYQKSETYSKGEVDAAIPSTRTEQFFVGEDNDGNERFGATWFRLPADYVPGTELTGEVIVTKNNFNDPICTATIQANFVRAFRDGVNIDDNGGSPSDTLRFSGSPSGNVQLGAATSANNISFTVSPPGTIDFAPGDVIGFGVYDNSANVAGFCPDYVNFTTVLVTYDVQ